MDMASSPSSWPKATNPSILEGGAETVLGEGNRGMRRPLGSAARQDGAPAARRAPPRTGREPHRGGPGAPAGPRNVRSRTRPAPPRRGPGPGRRCSEGDDPAVRWVPRRSCILKPSRIQGEVEDSDVIVAGIAFILSRARHICMLCDNWQERLEGRSFP